MGRQVVPHRVVAEMEEASVFTNESGSWELCNLVDCRQASSDGRLAALEELRHDNSPIELDFNLQGPNRTHLRTGFGVPSPTVTAIAPPAASRLRSGAPQSSQKPPMSRAPPAAAAVRVLRSVSTVMIPSVRGGGRRIAGVLSSGALSAGALVGRIAACSAHRATRLSGTALSGAVHAMRLAAAQPNRLRLLVRRLHVRHLLASPLRAIAFVGRLGNGGIGGGSMREVRAPAKARRFKSRGRIALNASADTAEPSPPPASATIVAAAPSMKTPVLRARSLLSTTTPEHAGLKEILSAPPSQPPYVTATAGAVPALLLSQGIGPAADTPSFAVTSQSAGSRFTAPQSPAAAVLYGTRNRGRHHPGRRLHAAANVIRGPARTVVAVSMAAFVVAKYMSAALLCAFFPRGCRYAGLAALLSGPSLPLPPLPGLPRPLPNPLPRGPLRIALAPLGPLRGPFAAFTLLRLLGPLIAPAVWRGVMYWQRTVPIIARYAWTGRRAAALRRSGRHEAADQLWQRQHEWGAGAIFDMLADLKGFYLKLGQILACKTDMLPPAYTASLSRLLDKLPPAPYRVVRRTIESELGAPPERLFREIDAFPLASATIAQVHRALLPDGRPVVVKVQHAASRASMASDLVNLRALSALVEAAGLQLGFDHGSLVREYAAQVPLEFDFAREAAVATSIRSSLASAAASFPALRRVVIPVMHPHLSNSRVLTMEYLDGVPLLDIEGMDLAVRHGLMTSLILAYGVMILRDGLFHSDPHPGNLLAMRKRRTASMPGTAPEVPGAGRPSSASPPASATSPMPGDGAAAAARPPFALHSPLSPAALGPSAAPLEADELQVALLDFGQAKQLSRASRVRYAKLVAAMAVRDDDLVLAVAGEVGLVVDRCSPGFAATATYILYDTRMDFPEAHMGPMDPEAHEFRTAKVPKLPQDLFMIMRVVTLLRGLLCSLQIDISAAQLWRPLALQVLADLTSVGRVLPLPTPDTAGNVMAGDGGGGGSLVDNALLLSVDWSSVDILDSSVSIRSSLSAPTPGMVAASGELTRQASNRPGGSADRASLLLGSKKVTYAQQRAERARREAQEAERKRREREAAKREEEARRRAEREAKAQRQREEKEAKATRQRAARQEAEERRRAEREEREARKRAEIEASNARRQAERKAAEAERAKSGRQQRGKAPQPQPPSSPAEVAAAGGGDASSSRSTSSVGVIHSPTPVRLTPPPLYVNLSPTSRLANTSGLNSPLTAATDAAAGRASGEEVQYYAGAADGVSTQGINPSTVQPALGAAAAVQQLPSNSISSARFLSHMAPLSATTRSAAATAQTGRKSYGDEAIAAAIRAATLDNPDEASKLLPSAASTPAAGGSIVRPPSPSPYGSTSLHGTAQSAVMPGGAVASVAAASGNGSDEGPVDELTARLIARANQFAAVMQQPPDGGREGSSSTTSQGGTSQTQPSGYSMAPGPGLRMMVTPGSQRLPLLGPLEQQQLLAMQQQQKSLQQQQQQAGGSSVSPPRDPGSSQRLQQIPQLPQKHPQHQQQLQQLQQLQQQLQMLRATRTAPSPATTDIQATGVSTSPSHSTQLGEPPLSSQPAKMLAPVSVSQPSVSQSGAQPPVTIPPLIGASPMLSPQAPSSRSTASAAAVASSRASCERLSNARAPSQSPLSVTSLPQLPQQQQPQQQQQLRRSQDSAGTAPQVAPPPVGAAVGSGTSPPGTSVGSLDIYAQARALLESTRRLVPPAPPASGPPALPTRPTPAPPTLSGSAVPALPAPTPASATAIGTATAGAITASISPSTGPSITGPVAVTLSATGGCPNTGDRGDGGRNILRSAHSTPHGDTTAPGTPIFLHAAARSISVVATTQPGTSAALNARRRFSMTGSSAIAEGASAANAPVVVQEIEPAANILPSPPQGQVSSTAVPMVMPVGDAAGGTHRTSATSEVSAASPVEGVVARELSAAILTPAASARRAPPGVAEGAAAGGGHRTADGMLLQSEEDYSMWLARQQQSGLPASETSASIPHSGVPQQQQQQHHHHLHHQQVQQLGQQLAQQQVQQALQQQLIPMHGPNTTWMGPGAPGWGPGTGAGTANEQAWAGGGASSSTGSTGPGGGSKTTSTARRGGVEAMKKGLSRIGRKIVGGLA